MLPTTQCAYRKGLGSCDALVFVSHTLQSALESGQEGGCVTYTEIKSIAQIDFCVAFDGVNHLGSALLVLEVLCCL